jgi:putative salt-induced outer membrane protein
MRRFLLFAAAPLLLADAQPVAVPEMLRAMLDAAMASGSEGDVATVLKYARAADPASGDTLAALAQEWRDARAEARRRELGGAGALELWTGKVELGGWFTTGNSDTRGITGAASLEREGLVWRHKLRGQFDYQATGGVTTREHYLVAYEPNRKLGPRAYLYGAAQYESDRFLGYRDRFTASAGAGYSAIKARGLKLDLELGPAFRHTAFTDAREEQSLAGRGSLDFGWQLTPALKVSQVASAYLEQDNSTVSSQTALDAKLFGPLSAKLSYQVQYESTPPAGGVSTDTTGRAALVYSF